MAEQTDVLIIGGGAIGVACAFYLQKSGRDITVLERGGLASGCSGENAGLIVPSHITPLAAPGVMGQGLRWMLDARSPFYIRPRLNWALAQWLWSFSKACSASRMAAGIPVLHELLQLSHRELVALDAELGLGLVQKGLLMTYAQEKGRVSCLQTAELAQATGLEVEVLDGAQLRQREPHVHPRAVGGVLFPQDAHLDPLTLVKRLMHAVNRQGVTLHCDTPVTEVVQEGGRITEVRSGEKVWKPKEVVLAGGAWSPGLIKGVRLPIEAGKGYSVTLPARGRIPSIPLILTEEKVSVTPLGDSIRFGGTLELGGLDATIHAKRVGSILNQAAGFLDNFDPNTCHAKVWHGFRPCSPDGIPLIGRYPGLKNLCIAGGHAMMGVSLAPVTGLLVADCVLGRKPRMAMEPLSPQRFL